MVTATGIDTITSISRRILREEATDVYYKGSPYTWRLFRQSLHLMFDGVPDSVDLAQVHACLLSQPGVSEVHDLHVWAMSTSHIALTAHLVMPGGHPGDAFFTDIARVLHERFDIVHPTLQIELSPMEHGCAQPARLAGGHPV